jgi:hypothetical protein
MFYHHVEDHENITAKAQKIKNNALDDYFHNYKNSNNKNNLTFSQTNDVTCKHPLKIFRFLIQHRQN